MTRSIVRWLDTAPRWGGWYALLLAILLLVPEAYGEHGRRAAGWLAVPPHPLAPGTVRDALLNVAIFVPVGLWLAAGAGRLAAAAGRLTSALAVGAAFSVLMESLQYVLGWRHSSLMDVAANTAGVALGALLALAVARARPSLPR
jgi:VanZ family protein